MIRSKMIVSQSVRFFPHKLQCKYGLYNDNSSYRSVSLNAGLIEHTFFDEDNEEGEANFILRNHVFRQAGECDYEL
jgi:hypothetical protein